VRALLVSEGRVKSSNQVRYSPHSAVEGDETIVEFFGQLWAIESPPPWGAPRVPYSTKFIANSGLLVWIRKDLVEWKEITPTDVSLP